MASHPRFGRDFVKKSWKSWAPAAVAGGAAGVVNGFLGGGGGMVLVPLLVAKCGLSRRKAFACSVAIIFPLCALSAVIYYTKGNLDLLQALPYLVGGLLGGLVGGKIFNKVPVVWLKRVFALLILYGAWSALFQ